MIVERKKGKFVITERTPSAKDFAPKALKLYRELRKAIDEDRISDKPVYYEGN
jgi:hypothetical protein